MTNRVTRATHAALALQAALLAVCATFPVRPAMAAADCPAPPEPVRDLTIDRYYADKAGTEVDAARKAEHAEAARPLVAFVRGVTDTADRAARHRDAGAAACAASWLQAWARGGALLGNMSSAQAQSQRKWDLAGLALAYIKIKPMLAAQPRADIETWLIQLADAVHGHAVKSGIKRNNHWYWIGVGAGATALATGSARHWEMARAVMQDAARDIRPDGTLPLEMARGARALHYHAFSVMAVVTLAEIGAAGGEDWYASSDGAPHRLVRVTAEGLADPAKFDRLAGVTQERPVNPGSGWRDLYAARFADRLPETLPAIGAKHRWLGGDVHVLAATLRSTAASR